MINECLWVWNSFAYYVMSFYCPKNLTTLTFPHGHLKLTKLAATLCNIHETFVIYLWYMTYTTYTYIWQYFYDVQYSFHVCIIPSISRPFIMLSSYSTSFHHTFIILISIQYMCDSGSCGNDKYQRITIIKPLYDRVC